MFLTSLVTRRLIIVSWALHTAFDNLCHDSYAVARDIGSHGFKFWVRVGCFGDICCADKNNFMLHSRHSALKGVLEIGTEPQSSHNRRPPFTTSQSTWLGVDTALTALSRREYPQGDTGIVCAETCAHG